MARFEQEGVEVTMPECPLIFMVSYLFDIGPTTPNGMGDAPVGHLEIAAWQQNTGYVLDSWQAITLHKLSLAYLSESQRATKPDAEAPWADAPYLKQQSNLVALRLQAAMQELANL